MDAPISLVPPGQVASQTHAALNNIEVGVKENGRVEFGLLGWKVEFYISNFSLSSPKLFQREGLQLARGENADVGVAVDSTGTIRLFYCYGEAWQSNLFRPHYKVCWRVQKIYMY